jgi:hypothetical protein
MPINVEVAQRDIRDYRDAYTWLRWHSWLWPTLAAVAIFVCVAAALSRQPYATYAYVYAGLVGVLYVWELLRVSSRMKNANDRHGSVSYTFTEDGFLYRSSVSHSETAWAAIDRAAETRRSFLLMYATGAFLIIPKRCFPDGTIPQFRALLRERLGPQAALKG